MTYTTLTYNGTEKALADWGVAAWRREVNNQASDSVGFDLVAAADGAEVFPYGAMVTLRRIWAVKRPQRPLASGAI